ncbi:MAG TPA: hypothetical protein VGK47_09420, partial [Nitrososphaeraceae archaeon]
MTSEKSDLSKIRISKRSFIYDSAWDFTSDLNHRPRTLSDSRLRIDWDKYIFSSALRKELQHLFGIYYVAPKMISKYGSVTPQTLCQKMHRSLAFLSEVIRRFPSVDMIDSLSQFEIIDLQETAKRYDFSSHAKQGLEVLYSPQNE